MTTGFPIMKFLKKIFLLVICTISKYIYFTTFYMEKKDAFLFMGFRGKVQLKSSLHIIFVVQTSPEHRLCAKSCTMLQINTHASELAGLTFRSSWIDFHIRGCESVESVSISFYPKRINKWNEIKSKMKLKYQCSCC